MKSHYEANKKCEWDLNTKQAGTSCVLFSNLRDEGKFLVLVDHLPSISE